MPNKKKPRILVVDDEPGNLFLLEGLLSEEGFTVLTALNGKDGMSIAKKDIPDVILLDVMMPDVTGLDVLDMLLKDPVTHNIPVIMVTAKVEAEDVEVALEKGAVEYIKKPINETEMLARLKTVLRLRNQEETLRQLLKSKEDFIAMVSHDVRGPFVSIAGFADMLLSDKELAKSLTKDHKEFLTFIIDTSNYIYDYFNKLLDWANIGAKEIMLKREQFPLLKIINTNILIYQHKLNEKHIDLELNIDHRLTIEADPVYMGQVINNLLGNAIKFTPKDGKITISSEISAGNILLKITDTGVGMGNITPEEFFSNPFHRSTRGTNGEKGTGVGLRICKMITDAHGFGLSFRSKQNEGTQFIVTIKLR